MKRKKDEAQQDLPLQAPVDPELQRQFDRMKWHLATYQDDEPEESDDE